MTPRRTLYPFAQFLLLDDETRRVLLALLVPLSKVISSLQYVVMFTAKPSLPRLQGVNHLAKTIATAKTRALANRGP